ncbi:DUF1456 family protein [Halomonas dongshanensis]|uniref:DUF1456 family protein n=1 Tax=Halomonas dongshanensis TaxID=2890835 RepID=A0ABT2EF06_9GAMM|nr:DUF1456 family protein [Halomonas dongshanensis]MCS2610168.1 DUF1456 family protein [Halomonas dongshanensis]
MLSNNDVLRRIRYIFDLKDTLVVKIFALAESEVSLAQVAGWLKKDEDEEVVKLKDRELAAFLNGFISFKRGKRDGPQPVPEKSLNNNLILQKLKIALNLKTEELLAVFEAADFTLSQHELSAFFRKPEHKNYRECKDQVLRNFLMGLQRQHRPTP